MSNKEALWEFVRGLTLGLSVVGLFLIFIVKLGGNAEQPNSPRFKVVDKYRYCDVVRYDAKDSARYAYFLDCNGADGP